MKKRLTKQEEFEIMKLVLDKFLWLGFGIMAYGLWFLFSHVESFVTGIWILVVGAFILIILMYILIKEYEFLK